MKWYILALLQNNQFVGGDIDKNSQELVIVEAGWCIEEGVLY